MNIFTAMAVTPLCGSLLLAATQLQAQEVHLAPNTDITTPSITKKHSAPTHRADNTLEHVLVSVPIHKQSSQTALPITLLSGEALRAEATATIGDTLANNPGIANASFGPAVGQPVIRGQQGARVSVLQNSLRSADASNVSADHAVSVEPLLADRVEVLRGPATLLYGGGAIGGVVNVIDSRIPTRQRDGMTGGLEYRHDSASDLDVTAFRVTNGAGDFAWHIDGLYRDWNNVDIPGDAIDEASLRDGLHHDDEPLENTRGYIANTGGRTNSLTIGGSHFFDSGLMGFAISRVENYYGIPPAGHAHDEAHDEAEDEKSEEGINIDLEQTRYDGRLELESPMAGIQQLTGLLSYTDYQHDEIEADGAVGTHFSNKSWETRLEITHEEMLGWHGVFGMQWREGQFSATGEESFIPETDSRTAGIFIVEGYDVANWTYELGLRLDHDISDPKKSRLAQETHFTNVSLSASVLWEVTDQWQWSLALSSAGRAPVAEELYSNVDAGDEYVAHGATQSIELGNPDLNTEQSRNADLAMSWQGQRVAVDITLFYNEFSDYIYLQNTGVEQDELAVLRYQQEDTRFQGIEFEARSTLLSGASSQLDLKLFGDTIRGKIDSVGDVPRLPPWRIGAKLNYKLADWSSYISVINASSQDKPGNFETVTAGYTRWDLGVDYRLPLGQEDRSLLLFVNAKNITDQEIRLSTSFLRNYAPEAGRSIIAGARYTF